MIELETMVLLIVVPCPIAAYARTDRRLQREKRLRIDETARARHDAVPVGVGIVGKGDVDLSRIAIRLAIANGEEIDPDLPSAAAVMKRKVGSTAVFRRPSHRFW